MEGSFRPSRPSLKSGAAVVTGLQSLVLSGTFSSLQRYWQHHFADKTFKGLYQANGFDLLLLIPYFVVMIILASYGVHRYVLVYLYYKHRGRRTENPPARFDELPRVTVQLPIFNEQFV